MLDEVLHSDRVSDEVIGFHCQQAAEKLLKALLSEFGIRFRKTNELGSLSELLASAGCRLPPSLEELDVFTPFGAIYRYEDYDSALVLDREQARQTLRVLRAWVEEQLRDRDCSGLNPLA